MKIKFLKSTLLVLLTFLSFSCSNDDDNNSTPNFQYQGTWSGTFTGTEDNGSWTANVNSSGVATGTATSTVFSNTYQLNGTVSSQGVFVATVGTASTGATFNGNMTTNGSASGTWINTYADMNGNWTGSKQ